MEQEKTLKIGKPHFSGIFNIFVSSATGIARNLTGHKCYYCHAIRVTAAVFKPRTKHEKTVRFRNIFASVEESLMHQWINKNKHIELHLIYI